jgi:MFS family permease
MVGLMQTVGNVTGFAIATFAAIQTGIARDAQEAQGLMPTADYLPLALIAIAVVEVVTMVSVVLRVGKGPPPKPREGRSWVSIAKATWATDILAEHSYVAMLVSRFLFLVGGGIMFNLVLVYLTQTHGYDQDEANAINLVILAAVFLASVVAILPGARLSDRLGRKPVIYASCVIGALGVGLTAIAPSVQVAIVGAVLFGVSGGTFLSVDWALMTDIIPRASAGRYMGLSNVATGAATALGVGIGGLTLDFVNRSLGTLTEGPRAAFIVALVLYVIAILLFRPVVEPPRHQREGAAPAAA